MKPMNMPPTSTATSDDPTRDDFSAKLRDFVWAAQRVYNVHFDGRGYAPRRTVTLSTDRGSRYVRISHDQGVFCFVEIASGDILKAKSWARPDVKCKVRRNLFRDDHLIAAVDMHRGMLLQERARICLALGIQEADAAPGYVILDGGAPIDVDDPVRVAKPPNDPTPSPWTEERLARLLRSIDKITPDIERALVQHRKLRDSIAARLEAKTGRPAPPPLESGANVIPLRRRPSR